MDQQKLSPACLPLSGNSECFPTRYRHYGVLGTGMTGYILRLSKSRVVKVAKLHSIDALKREKAVYERLGIHKGIIQCFGAFDDGIELAFAEQGDLERYINTSQEPPESVKAKWIKSLADALSHVHSRKVFIDDIALRNVLVTSDKELKLADFGQSYLFSVDEDMDTACEDGLTAKIEIAHLGWIIYSISVWNVHKYYYFEADPPQWPSQQDLPRTEDLFSGILIRKCWSGEYLNAYALSEDVMVVLGELGGLCTEDPMIGDISTSQ